ncbi:MAG: malate synthase G, partial [Marivivens sp.]|nr:malate synthase G [Marivivens sp.]
MTYVKRSELEVSADLAALIENEILLGIDADAFWNGYSALLKDLVPVNRALIEKREDLQAQIDGWYKAQKGKTFDVEEANAFLREIGYLQPAPAPFEIKVENVDPEIASIAGPQLVVPVMNARFALNAANARWGSLYDALYGTDAIEGKPAGKGYDAERGAKVVAWARAHLDEVAPLANGSWADVEA